MPHSNPEDFSLYKYGDSETQPGFLYDLAANTLPSLLRMASRCRGPASLKLFEEHAQQ